MSLEGIFGNVGDGLEPVFSAILGIESEGVPEPQELRVEQ